MNNNHNYLYAHQPSEDSTFIFPISGMSFGEDCTELEIGKTRFIMKSAFDFSECSLGIMERSWFERQISDVKTLAVVSTQDVSAEWISHSDRTSIALQLAKQSIGIIYLLLYMFRDRVDYESIINISSLGKVQIDEGLNPFISNTQLFNYPIDVSNSLTFVVNTEFKKLCNDKNSYFDIYYNTPNTFYKKILKSLELFYCIYNETSVNERLFKFPIIPNMLFSKNKTDNLNSNFLHKQIECLLNNYNVDIYSKIPDDILKIYSDNTLAQLSKELNKIYQKIRNKFAHGKFNLYQEFCCVETLDLLVYKLVIMELMKIIIFEEELRQIKSSRDLNNYILTMANQK